MTTADTGITKPADLPGKTIATAAGSVSELLFPAYANRDLVSRFVGAAMKGLRYTVDHPDEAAAILNKAEPTSAVPAAVAEINAMKPYVAPPDGGPIGSFDQARVQSGIAELETAGLMPKGLTPDKIVDPAFTQK